MRPLAAHVKVLADRLGIVNQPNYESLNDTTLGYMLLSLRHIEEERNERNDARD